LRFLRYVKFGRTRASLRVRLIQGDQAVAEATYATDRIAKPQLSTRQLILVLGNSIGEQQTIRQRMRDQASQFAIAQISEVDRLPNEWYGYAAVDTMVVATSELTLLEQMNEESFRAFQWWLQMGGRLLLSVGRRGAEVFDEQSPLASLAPGEFVEVAAQRSTSGLEDYANSSERLDTPGGRRIRRFSVPVSVFTDVVGRVESSETGGPEGQVPTVVRYPYGLGQIIFVAFDLDQEPFLAWKGRTALVARLLQDTYARRKQRGEEPLPGAPTNWAIAI
jgi:hypothetical protein